MTARSVADLNVPATVADHYRASIASDYRFRRALLDERPAVAARAVMCAWAEVVAHTWQLDGAVNDYAGFAYLTAVRWYEDAKKLQARRDARKAVAA